MELAGRPLTLEVGKLAELANAASWSATGDTRVLGLRHRVRPSPRRHRLLPPSPVDFEEKMYSVGRIPGSFNRRRAPRPRKGHP